MEDYSKDISVKKKVSNISSETADTVNFHFSLGGGVAQRLGHQISDQGVPGSNPSRCTFRCGLEQVTFNLLSTG